MTVLIHTYSNPYKLTSENYYINIKNCFHLCISQTLVNGLCDNYSDFFVGKLTTYNRFLNILYDGWNSNAAQIQQRAAIDNVLNSLDFSQFCRNGLEEEKLRNSLRLNRSQLCDSIRTLFELGVDRTEAVDKTLTIEQKCMFAIYEELKRTKNRTFKLRTAFKESDIDNAIDATITKAIEEAGDRANNNIDRSLIRKDAIVIHGIHQFTPLMLRAIDELQQYKTIHILFNYVPTYKNVYQTWLDVYGCFENKVDISPFDLTEKDNSMQGAKIAAKIGGLLNGDASSIGSGIDIPVRVFDNQTEFAGYIAQRFEEAKEKAKAIPVNRRASILYYMQEQIYSADSSVNNILKIYFPEQFKERQFLDYPIGHFFIALVNMWDQESGRLKITNIDTIRDSLSCGIIHEDVPGSLLSIFNKTAVLLDGESTLKEMIVKLQRLEKTIDGLDFESEEKAADIKRFQYFNVLPEEINQLIHALDDLNRIADSFIKDFNEQSNDFKEFYRKIGELLKNVLDDGELDEEFADIISRVLLQLEEVKDLDANASFDCLRETMQLYLQQINSRDSGANWIVRNFEQIDGDVLRTHANPNARIYHYACLSDTDMADIRTIHSWPLDQDFFENALDPVDWKYRVYMRAKLEYRNFKRYALFYGLLFGAGEIRLSMIRNKDDEVNELYYLLRILNAKDDNSYIPETSEDYFRRTADIHFEVEYTPKEYDDIDLIKYRLCPARFLLETIGSGETVYKEKFLIMQYLKTLMEEKVMHNFSNKAFVEGMVEQYLEDELNSFESEYCDYLNYGEKMDIISSVVEKLRKDLKGRKFGSYSPKERFGFKLRKNLLISYINSSKEKNDLLRPVAKPIIDDYLNEETLHDEHYNAMLTGSVCEYCSQKQLCLEPYKIKPRKRK